MLSGPCKSKLLMVIFFICYCIFRVYLVTGNKNPDNSQEGTSRIPKLFFISPLGPGYSNRWPNPIFEVIFLDSHRFPGLTRLTRGYTRAFRTRPLRRTRTQTEVRNSDSDLDSDF
jgi:hypothetical protein